jgi:predicted secreted hydrolase
MVSRRSFLQSSLCGGLMGTLAPLHSALAQTDFAQVTPGRTLVFPYDEGSHPGYRTEWWYITGWLENAARKPLGFQITFFRARPSRGSDNPSAFALRKILIAHAALSDPQHGKLIHEQRAARTAFDLAGAREDGLHVWLDVWLLRAELTGYRAKTSGAALSLDLAFTPTRPALLQGDAGYSRKGPGATSASYYYSLPHLAVHGEIERAGKRESAQGSAWLDHEWSSSYMDERALGWDWIGINLDDGGALMAYRMRNDSGSSLWAGATLRVSDQSARTYAPNEVRFTPLRLWRSPRTGTNYPVEWAITIGDFEIEIKPLMDDQENDTRLTTGAIYWEGAVRASRGGQPVGRGYLELTGYWRRLRL